MNRRLLALALVLSLIPGAALAQAPAQKAALEAVEAPEAPPAIGPYSQAIVAGGFLFASGQVPRDPKTGEMLTGSIEQSTERVLDNLAAVLKARGLTLSDVVKTTVFLTKADDFAPMNTAYAKRFGDHRPARSTVIVAALPKGAPIEIELIAKVRETAKK